MPIREEDVQWDQIDPGAIQWEDQKSSTSPMRSMGVGTKGVLEGLASIPTMIGDAANLLTNYGIRGINALGGDLDYLQPASQSVSNLLGAVLPSPQTPEEQLTYQISKGGGAALSAPGVGLLSGSKMAAPLLQNVGMQTTAGGVGAGTSEMLRQQGASPTTQMVGGLGAGLMTPMALSTLGSTAKGAMGAVKGIFDPFKPAGRERIVGSALRGLASDEQAAMSNLQQAQPILSQPTVGTTAKDYGLAAAERTMRSRQPAKFAQRVAEQNVDRINYLDRYANAPLQKATNKRDAALNILDQARTKNPIINAQPVVNKIDEILAGPAGKRKAVRTALTDIRKSLYSTDDQLESSLDNLYGVRQNIGDKFDPKAMQDPKTSNYRVAKREIMQVKNELDKQLADKSPEFAEYLKVYARQSQPIDQIEAARILKEKAQTSATSLEGENFITPGQWKTHYTSKKAELSKILTKPQMRHLDKITKDLDRGNALSSIKPLGSDTVQNLSVSNIIGRALGHRTDSSNPVVNTLTRPLRFLYQVPDAMAEELLADAMLDPKLAVELMRKATPQRTEKIAEILRKRLEAVTYGATLGTAQEQ